MTSATAAAQAEIHPLVSRDVDGGWVLVCPADYETLVCPDGALAAPLRELIAFATDTRAAHGFRRDVGLQGFPVLVGVFPGEKRLLVGSRRLSRELTLLDGLEAAGESDPALREHVEAMGRLDPRHFPSEWQWVTWKERLADWTREDQWADVEELAREKLRHLVKHVQQYQPSLFERVSDWGLGLTAQFALIRIHLLKFLALLPSLDHDKNGHEVKRNLIESLRRLQDDHEKLRRQGARQAATRPLPRPYAMGLGFALQVARFLPAGLLALLVRGAVKKMAKRFIAGESIASSDRTLHSLHNSRREATLDQLGELVVSEDEADEYLKRVLAIVHGLKVHVSPGEKNAAGIPKAHVSIKVSALASDFKPQAFEATYTLVAPRLRKILVEARREQVFVNIDAEHYHYRDLVLALYRRVLLETPELHGWEGTGIVVQAYLRDGAGHLRDVVALARERGVRMPIRLVKGAYWDAETIEAEVHSHHAPQFLNKEETDLHFRQLVELALAHPAQIQLAVGSHNLQDHCFAEALRQLRHPQAPVIEHQCLHMTYEALSHGLAKMGWPTRNYMPIGNLLVGMAYLVRRIMENSSQVGVLTIMRSHNKKEALASPAKIHQEKRAQGQLVRDDLEARLDSGFKNCTPARLYVASERESFTRALAQRLALYRSKQAEWRGQAGAVVCSSDPELVVGVLAENTAAEAEASLERSARGFREGDGWSELPLVRRLAPLLRAADLMWRQRDDLAAHIVLEAGKTWGEALGDVDEAIDFINFYCREELRLTREEAGLIPRGPVAVIAPWNFPLAIPCGMTVGALVAGNPVILKPAEQTPLVAHMFAELLWEAGVPRSALQFLHGEGEKVGAPLVQHPAVAGVVFTGSKGVGQWIYRNAAGRFLEHPRAGRSLPKRVVAEMGGKNAIVVTNNCEQDETVSGILYSAFGHAGQKCSACSRVLVDAQVKDSLLKRLVKAVEDLEAGAATDPKVAVNPLITQADQQRVREAVRSAREEAEKHGGKVWVDRSEEDLPGWTVGPVVIELPASRARSAESWAQREIFGPVVHVVPCQGLEEMVEVFNGTEYGLTGGVYGQSQDDIDALVSRLRCGNLYVNRPNTGARVAIEPFGGFKLSGTGPKAGGRDYLRAFHASAEKAPSTESVAWEAGSGYQFSVPRTSQLSAAGRLARLQKCGQGVLERFEATFHRVGEGDKRALADYLRWLQGNLLSHMQAPHPNLRIPGQLSYDAKDLPREAVLLVMGAPVPRLAGVFHLLSALAAGSGVAVVCTNQASWSAWKQLVEIAWLSGFSRQNLEIYLMGEGEVQLALRRPELESVYAEGGAAFAEKVFGMALDPAGLTQHMRALHFDGEHPSFQRPSDWLSLYLVTRSFAVNTMRHGAPLDLSV